MGLFSKILLGIASPYVKQNQVNAELCRQYCQARGYAIMPNNLPAGSLTIAGSTSAIISDGYGAVANGFEGMISGSPCLVSLWEIPGAGPQSTITEYFQMGAVKLAHRLPSVILQPKNGRLSQDDSLFNNLKNVARVQLEGDFNKYFNVFSSSSNPANAFELLPPNVMAKLIDTYSNAAIELSGDYLYLFLPVEGSTSGSISIVRQPTFSADFQDAFLQQLSELASLFADLNQTTSPIIDSEIITDNPGIVINLDK